MSIRAASVMTLVVVLSVFDPQLWANASQAVPDISSNTVVFVSGKILRYEPRKVVHTDPEEAHRRGQPVSISEQPVLIEEWKRVALIKTAELYEGFTRELVVYDYQGNSLNHPLTIMGDVYFLKNTSRIFLGQKSSHFLVNKSFLLDHNGKLLREVSQSENVVDFGFSADGKLIWIVSHHIRHGKPFGRAKVIDSDGKELKTVEFVKAGKIEVTYKQVKYKISVSTPEIPG